MKKIKVGDKIPDFRLKDQNGDLFDVSGIIGRSKLVIFFYPLDGSLGCTREACYFRDLTKAFSEAGAVIAGISSQSVESHMEFAKKQRLTYPLLSDDGGAVRKLFGVKSDLFGLIPGRATFIADESGIVKHIFKSQTNVNKHVDEALRICLLLQKPETAVQ